ncbi:MAG: MerC domain-containing protein [Myxococcota bacterium]|nr:MerC domain-containing protein [Myxococcota bacterium]
MTESKSESPKDERIDRFGTVASSLCALHCAICALLPAALGALGLGLLLSQEAEWIFTVIAIFFALGALLFSWRRHRSYAVAGLLSLGIVGLLASRGLEMGSEHHHDEHHHGEATHDEESNRNAHQTMEKHDDHHDDHAHADGTSEKHHENHKEAHHDDHHEDHHDGHGGEDGHSDSMHTLGASIGVFGGILLVLGHLLNIRTSRNMKTSDDCCD